MRGPGPERPGLDGGVCGRSRRNAWRSRRPAPGLQRGLRRIGSERISPARPRLGAAGEATNHPSWEWFNRAPGPCYAALHAGDTRAGGRQTGG